MAINFEKIINTWLIFDRIIHTILIDVCAPFHQLSNDLN